MSCVDQATNFVPHLLLGTRVSFVEIGMCSGGENVHQLMLSKATLNNIKREVLCRKMERQRAFKMKNKAEKGA